MASVDWPAELPPGPTGFSEQPKSIISRTPTDSGPVKTRRRFTKAARTASMSFILTVEQALLLDDFFENELQGGAVGVRFLHPWRRVIKEMYITTPPSYSNNEGIGVNVSIQVEYF